MKNIDDFEQIQIDIIRNQLRLAKLFASLNMFSLALDIISSLDLTGISNTNIVLKELAYLESEIRDRFNGVNQETNNEKRIRDFMKPKEKDLNTDTEKVENDLEILSKKYDSVFKKLNSIISKIGIIDIDELIKVNRLNTLLKGDISAKNSQEIIKYLEPKKITDKDFRLQKKNLEDSIEFAKQCRKEFRTLLSKVALKDKELSEKAFKLMSETKFPSLINRLMRVVDKFRDNLVNSKQNIFKKNEILNQVIEGLETERVLLVRNSLLQEIKGYKKVGEKLSKPRKRKTSRFRELIKRREVIPNRSK